MLGCYVFLKGRGECGVCITKAASRLTVDSSQASARGIGELGAPGRRAGPGVAGLRAGGAPQLQTAREPIQTPLSVTSLSYYTTYSRFEPGFETLRRSIY